MKIKVEYAGEIMSGIYAKPCYWIIIGTRNKYELSIALSLCEPPPHCANIMCQGRHDFIVKLLRLEDKPNYKPSVDIDVKYRKEIEALLVGADPFMILRRIRDANKSKKE